MTMRPMIEQVTQRVRRALRELDAAAALVEAHDMAPAGCWVTEAQQATAGVLRVLEAHCASQARRRWTQPCATADEVEDDATIRRVVGFSRRWGMGGCAVVNLFGLRSTDPAALRGHPDPVGPGNDAAISEWAERADSVVVAWGAVSWCQDRAAAVPGRLGRSVACLGVTAGGHPRHPLYVRGDTQRRPFLPRDEHRPGARCGRAAW